MMISLKSADGEIFEVEEAVAVQSNVIKLIIKEGCTSSSAKVVGDAISLPDIKSKILFKIVEYWNRHAKAARTVSEVKNLENFDSQFFKSMTWDTILDVATAAQYLDTMNLLDLTCHAIVVRIEKKSPEKIRKFTNEEKAEGNNEDAREEKKEEAPDEQIPENEKEKEFTVEDAANTLLMMLPNSDDDD